ncbi:hypothetical protein LCGC14_1706020 [marine sediment metagenome]|uniref:Uncharacterized protein n=1 Tax=marine sediment metagenome TaxID=412755 RepID=A0A0F9HG89_9ZZZZ
MNLFKKIYKWYMNNKFRCMWIPVPHICRKCDWYEMYCLGKDSRKCKKERK